MKKRIQRILEIIAALTLALRLLSGSAVYAEQEWSPPVLSDVSVSTDEGCRGYKVRIDIYSSPEALSELRPVSVAVVADVSSEMAYLSEKPGNAQRLETEAIHKSIDQNEVLYTEMEGRYVPIFLRDECWYIAGVNDRGERVSGGEAIGRRSEDGDVFYREVYLKGETKTRLECQLDSIISMAESLAAVSPGSELGIILGSERIGFTGLNQEGIQEIRAELSAILLSETGLSRELELCTALIEKAKNESRHVICFKGAEYRDRKKSVDAAVRTLRDRVGNVNIYGVDFTGREEGDPILEAVASAPEYCYSGTLDSQMISELQDMIIPSNQMKAEYFLDPRFDVSVAQKRKPDFCMEEAEDGGKKLSWDISLPRGREFSQAMELEIVAKDGFPGGNDIPLSEKASGIYQNGEKDGLIETVSVNVPLKLELSDIEAEIFRGQSIPASIDGRMAEDKITEKLQLDWCGREPTGEFAFGWEEGGEVKADLNALKSRMPGQDKSIAYIARYTPASFGEDSIGTPVSETSFSAVYDVRFISGTVKLIYDLTGREESWGSTGYAVFKLQNESFSRYAAVSLKDRTEDGEFLKLETEFTDLPYGTYRLSREYCFTEAEGLIAGGMEELTCSVGIEENNGSVDLSRDSCVLYIRGGSEDKAEPSAEYYAEAGISSFKLVS